jgi:hypothetical protein
MRTWVHAAVLGWLCGIGGTELAATATPRENADSVVGESDDALLRRVGYRAPAGARRVGRVFPSKSGDEVAFFEEREQSVSLVVAIKGGASARWAMSPDATHLEVYWLSSSELVLGKDLLAPRMRVKFYVAGG